MTAAAAVIIYLSGKKTIFNISVSVKISNFWAASARSVFSISIINALYFN